ncbi:unnamed protein product [Rotaria sp. Silwood1]|nr:unnamed protein product [Rotaria sp. Silwood1]
MTFGWRISSFLDKSVPSTYFHNHFNNHSSSSSTYHGFNKMMATKRQHFRQMSTSSLLSAKAYVADLLEGKKKLDAVAPVCTTTENSPPTISIQNNKRKSLRTTQTTTCVKESIINGEKHIYKEIIVTDDKGLVMSQSNRLSTAASPSKINIEPIKTSTEQINFLDNDSISSNSTLFHFDQTYLSSSLSDLNLSIALQSIDDVSSLPLSILDNEEYLSTNDADDNKSLLLYTSIQVTSDNESVLYSRLPNELNIGTATFDSDLERID